MKSKTVSFAVLLAIAAPLAPAWCATRVLPDHRLTPGAVRTTNAVDVCEDRHTRQLRHWSRARDNRILAEYGLPAGPHPDCEVDHLIPLDLGGADEDTNLWPEPRRSVEPMWNAERKDRLEWKLADAVCSGVIGGAIGTKGCRTELRTHRWRFRTDRQFDPGVVIRSSTRRKCRCCPDFG